VSKCFALQGWAGRTVHLVEIVGETPKCYRVKLLKDSALPGARRSGKAGDVVLMPKYRIFEEAPRA